MTAFDEAWNLMKYQEDQAPTIGSTPIWRAEQAMPDIHERPDYYVGDYQEEQHTEMFRDTMAALHQTRGAPYEQLKVYRAIPEHIDDEVFGGSGEPCINEGDWVATSEDYAREHGDAYFDGNYRIVEEMVNAHDLYTHGDSIYEYGWVGHRNPHSGDVIEKAPYHGTTDDRLEEIMREGLKPQSPDMFSESGVWYSKTPKQAISFSKIRSEGYNNEPPDFEGERGWTQKRRGNPVLLQFPQSAVTPPESGQNYSTTTIPSNLLTAIRGPPRPTDHQMDNPFKTDVDWKHYDDWSDKIDTWKKEMMQRHLEEKGGAV